MGYVFSAASHPALAQERLAERRMVCAVPKGLLNARQAAAGTLSMTQLATLPVIALDGRDPLGLILSRVLRDSGTRLHEVMSVQTYHVALALAQHGVGVALVESCTAASADLDKVDILALEPTITTTVHALRPTARPNSLMTRHFTRCMQQALGQVV